MILFNRHHQRGRFLLPPRTCTLETRTVNSDRCHCLASARSFPDESYGLFLPRGNYSQKLLLLGTRHVGYDRNVMLGEQRVRPTVNEFESDVVACLHGEIEMAACACSVRKTLSSVSPRSHQPGCQTK